ncbi:MAG: 50S ribosomal protein L11 methyltransferase [Fibromonadales bacterium]|nr:50S ribosomal protein L11 methyltransferase [Fibromonadales bacterium]
MIPRQETELIIDILKNSQLSTLNSQLIADIGTGTGALAIAAALELNAEVWACDISEEALELARENVALHKLKKKVALAHSDLLCRAKRC